MNAPSHPASSRNVWRNIGVVMLLAVMLAVLAIASGCKKEAPAPGGDSDATGYLCGKCKAKLFTDRDKPSTAKCPKCSQDALMAMGGYVCDKDQHITITSQRGDRFNVPVCEKCQAQLTTPMMFPKAKDFEAWGATKF